MDSSGGVDIYQTMGIPAPWDDANPKEKQIYVENFNNSLIPIAIYLIFSIIGIVWMTIRYPTDYIFQTMLFIFIVWIIAGVVFMWYLYVHSQKGISIALGVVFVIIEYLLIWSTLEMRYQNVYLKHPDMLKFFN